MKKRSAPPKAAARLFAGTAAVVAAALFFGGGPSTAMPAPQTDQTAAPNTATPSPIPTGSNILKLGASVFFVLDAKISSKTSRSGDVVRAHLKDDLVVGGQTVARAGSPVDIKISDVHGAKAPDQDGSIDIYFEPFALVNQASLPLHTPTSHLTVNVSAGAESTAGLTDQIKDIFIPGHMIYRLFRKGAQVQLDAGTVVRARTAAIVDANRPGAPVVIPPPSVTLSTDTPHAQFKPLPFYTTKPKATPLPRATPSPTPTPEPSATP